MYRFFLIPSTHLLLTLFFPFFFLFFLFPSVSFPLFLFPIVHFSHFPFFFYFHTYSPYFSHSFLPVHLSLILFLSPSSSLFLLFTFSFPFPPSFSSLLTFLPSLSSSGRIPVPDIKKGRIIQPAGYPVHPYLTPKLGTGTYIMFYFTEKYKTGATYVAWFPLQ